MEEIKLRRERMDLERQLYSLVLDMAAKGYKASTYEGEKHCNCLLIHYQLLFSSKHEQVGCSRNRSISNYRCSNRGGKKDTSSYWSMCNKLVSPNGLHSKAARSNWILDSLMVTSQNLEENRNRLWELHRNEGCAVMGGMCFWFRCILVYLYK